MPNSIYLIYKHTSPSGKSYIGQTSNFKYRTWRHQRIDSGCIAFSNAIKKYGWDSFTTEILADNLTLTEANQLEEQYITIHNTLVPFGYNLHTGGLNHQVSDETRQKMSEAKIGVCLSDEHKFNISNSTKGKPKPPRSDAHKQSLSNSRKGTNLTNEHCANISKSAKGKPKPVVECPHCGKQGGGPSMLLYHFDKCKLALIDIVK